MTFGTSSFQFTALPDDVVRDLLKGWLRIDDISKLDSAHCGHATRSHFLQTLKRAGTVLDMYANRCTSQPCLLLTWLHDRGLVILNWKFEMRNVSVVGDFTRYAAPLASLLELMCHDSSNPSFQSVLPYCVNMRVLNVCTSVLPIEAAQLLSRHCPKLRRIGWNRSGVSDSRTYSHMPIKYILSQCRSVEELVMYDVSVKHECVKQCITAGKKVFALGQIGKVGLNADTINQSKTPTCKFMLVEVGTVHMFSERFGIYAGFTAEESNQLLADYMHKQGMMYTVHLSITRSITPLINVRVGLCALELDNCTNLTADTLAALLRAPYLQRLTLTANHTLQSLLPEDYPLHNSASSSPSKVTHLTMHGFSAVTLMSVVEFTLYCPLLKELLLYVMPHVDKDRVMKLRRKLMKDT